MDRRDFARLGLGLAAGGTAAAAFPAAADEGKAEGGKAKHRVAIQVSSEEHKVQELALGNAHNYAAYYKAKGEPYQIEVVAFGPGYNMMRSDISMVAGNIEALKKELGDGITFSACQTHPQGDRREHGADARAGAADQGGDGHPERHRAPRRAAGAGLGVYPAVRSTDPNR